MFLIYFNNILTDMIDKLKYVENHEKFLKENFFNKIKNKNYCKTVFNNLSKQYTIICNNIFLQSYKYVLLQYFIEKINIQIFESLSKSYKEFDNKIQEIIFKNKIENINLMKNSANNKLIHLYKNAKILKIQNKYDFDVSNINYKKYINNIKNYTKENFKFPSFEDVVIDEDFLKLNNLSNILTIKEFEEKMTNFKSHDYYINNLNNNKCLFSESYNYDNKRIEKNF